MSPTSVAAAPAGEPIPITVIVRTKNEAKNIRPCLEAARGFAQVLVVDSLSKDGTPEIARACGAEVIAFEWNGRYPKKAEWSIAHPAVRHDWILMLDADEYLTPPLVEELRELMRRGPSAAGYFIDGRFVFLRKVLKWGHKNSKLMLFDRRRTRYPHPDDLDVPWEIEGHYQPIVDGPVGRLRHPLIHDDRKPIEAWFKRHDVYVEWEVRMIQRGESEALAASDTPFRRRLKAIFRAIPFRGTVAFLHSYVYKLGFLDGRAGFHFAVARGFYYWRIRLMHLAEAADPETRPHPVRQPAAERGERAGA